MIRLPAEKLPLDEPANRPDMCLEIHARARFGDRIAGIDEAGRGPLAGPVVVAAVILPANWDGPDLDDSKKLSATQRTELETEILRRAQVSIAAAGPRRIDDMNIRQATLWAMARAAAGLAEAPHGALVDGRDVPPALTCPGQAVIKGDARSMSIAAASIIAKTARDRLMIAMGAHWPDYGFERHMGYGTKAHLAALRQFGPTALHRRSFAPVRDALSKAATEENRSVDYDDGLLAAL